MLFILSISRWVFKIKQASSLHAHTSFFSKAALHWALWKAHGSAINHISVKFYRHNFGDLLKLSVHPFLLCKTGLVMPMTGSLQEGPNDGHLLVFTPLCSLLLLHHFTRVDLYDR